MDNHSINTHSQPSAQPEHVSTLPGRLVDRVRLVKRFPGLQRDVAKRLRLKGAGGVNHVVKKRATSKRIEEAILEEINRRIDMEQMKADSESAA